MRRSFTRLAIVATLLCCQPIVAPARADDSQPGVATDVKTGFHNAGHAIVRGAHAAGHAIVTGAHAVGHAAERGGQRIRHAFTGSNAKAGSEAGHGAADPPPPPALPPQK